MTPSLNSITIITSSFNDDISLEKTAISIANQSIIPYWIVIDNNSTDSTKKIIENYSHIVSTFVSEPDFGIYDAWNKALPYVQSEWILFLGAGDLLVDPHLIENANLYLDNNYPLCYGNVLNIDRRGNFMFKLSQVDTRKWDQLRPFLPHHQGCFHNIKYFNDPYHLRFDTSYKIGGDAKLLIQLLEYGSFLYIDIDVCEFMMDGLSSTPSSLPTIVSEYRRIIKELRYYHPPNPIKRWREIPLYFKLFLYYLLGDRLYRKCLRFLGKKISY